MDIKEYNKKMNEKSFGIYTRPLSSLIFWNRPRTGTITNSEGQKEDIIMQHDDFSQIVSSKLGLRILVIITIVAVAAMLIYSILPF